MATGKEKAEDNPSCADKEERIKGVYDVWQRLGVVHHAGPGKSSWNSASCEEMIALVKQVW